MRKTDDLKRFTKKILKNDPTLRSELEKADRAWDIAMQIRTLREKRGFTQTKLAEIARISQPNLARIENADYQSYTLKTLEKVTSALDAKVDVVIIPKESNIHIQRPILNFT